MAKKAPLIVGDRVAYSAAWLRSTGNSTGPAGALRGTVTGFQPLGGNRLAAVDWEGRAPGNVLESNLARVGSIAFSEA